MTDFPIEDCALQAAQLVAAGAKVHQKWTCGACGSRQTMEEENKFFRSGRCEACGAVSLIHLCNYLTIFNARKPRR